MAALDVVTKEVSIANVHRVKSIFKWTGWSSLTGERREGGREEGGRGDGEGEKGGKGGGRGREGEGEGGREGEIYRGREEGMERVYSCLFMH